MTRLPFLVEYGDLVWKLLAALAAAAAIVVVRWDQARRERRATARGLAARKQAMTAPVEGLATLRGTLHGGRASSVSLLYLRGRRPYYDERAAELWLDCEGERVTLVGPVRVVRGTRLVSTRDRRSGVPDGERAVRSSPILHRLTAMTASVGDGDAVFVTAQLAARPADEALGYREAATAWTARPYGDAIEVLAAEPAVYRVPLGSTRAAASGLVGAAAMVVALWGAGAAAIAYTSATQHAPGALAPVALGELDALALAAATPGHRDEALETIETRLAMRTVRTAETFALWRAVARERGSCGAEIRARIAQDDIDGLAQLAKHCKDDRAAGDAYQLLGMFHEAVARDDERKPAEQHIESLLAMSDWRGAMRWAWSRRVALVARHAPAQRDGALQCAAEWFSMLADPHDTSATLPAWLRVRDPACAVFAALTAYPGQEANALAKLDVSDPSVAVVARLLAWARGSLATLSGVVLEAPALHAAVFAPADRMAVARALLSGPAYTRSWSATRDLLETITWRAVLAMLNEQPALARAWSSYVAENQPRRVASYRPAFECIDPQGFAACNRGRALDAAVALRFRKPVPRLSMMDDPQDAAELWDRARGVFWGSAVERDTCDRPELGDAGRFSAAVLRAAHDGDARDMAALLARCRVRDARVLEAAFAVWPRVRDGRAELAEVLRRFDLGPAATDPLAVIGRAALRRDIATMIGDERAAEAWRGVVERHLAAFSGGDPLTALVVREMLRDAES